MGPNEDLPGWLVDQIVDMMMTTHPVAMGVLNLQLRHVVVNRALGRLYGIEPPLAVGATPQQLLGTLGVELEARCRTVVTGGRPETGHSVTGVLGSAPQSEVHWRIDCLPLTDGDGNTAALMLVVSDITARTRAMRSLNDQRRALAYQASHDPVTSLANRFQLLEVLQFHLQGNGRPTAFLIDLDGFKEVNDVNGHAAGDHVLAVVADRLRNAVRQEDLVARYGGDEFVLVVRDEVDTDAFATRVADLIGEPIAWQGRTLHVGASVGSATTGDGDSVSALLRRADEAMYRIKEERRSRR